MLTFIGLMSNHAFLTEEITWKKALLSEKAIFEIKKGREKYYINSQLIEELVK